jgi:hypothetical protein
VTCLLKSTVDDWEALKPGTPASSVKGRSMKTSFLFGVNFGSACAGKWKLKREISHKNIQTLIVLSRQILS